MKIRNPVLVLVLMVLAYSCIAGCTGNRGNYGSTSKPTAPDSPPGVSPTPAAPPRIPSTETSLGAHLSIMTSGENAELRKNESGTKILFFFEPVTSSISLTNLYLFRTLLLLFLLSQNALSG